MGIFECMYYVDYQVFAVLCDEVQKSEQNNYENRESCQMEAHFSKFRHAARKNAGALSCKSIPSSVTETSALNKRISVVLITYLVGLRIPGFAKIV